MAMMDGKPGVIEYSEIDPAMRVARDENGELIYNYSHICINNFTRQFLQDVADHYQDKLRYSPFLLLPSSFLLLLLFPLFASLPQTSFLHRSFIPNFAYQIPHRKEEDSLRKR